MTIQVEVNGIEEIHIMKNMPTHVAISEIRKNIKKKFKKKECELWFTNIIK